MFVFLKHENRYINVDHIVDISIIEVPSVTEDDKYGVEVNISDETNEVLGLYDTEDEAREIVEYLIDKFEMRVEE